MRLFLIVLFVAIVSAGKNENKQRLSRGILHGLDINQILAQVEPGFATYNHQQYVVAPPPLVQQYSIPYAPISQQQIVNLATPILNQQYNAAPEQSYNAPKQQQNNAAVDVRDQSVAVSAQQQPANSVPASSFQSEQRALPNQQYGQPDLNFQRPQAPQREYRAPDREYGVPDPPAREYGIPQANAQVPPAREYGVPAPPAREYGVPQANPQAPPERDYGVPRVTVPQREYFNPQPNNQAARPVEISRPEPAQSYGVPNANVVLSQPQPAQSYGQPSSHQANANSLSDFGFGNNFGGGHDDSADYTRDVSIHVPVAEQYEQQPQVQYQPRVPKKPKKNYKIIFIKAPAPPPPPVPIIPEIEPEPEQKTLVYVLVQKPEPAPPIVIPTPAPAPKSKPEVYFVKYRQAIHDGHSGSQENFERGSPIGGNDFNVDDGQRLNVPNQDFDLPQEKHQIQTNKAGY